MKGFFSKLLVAVTMCLALCLVSPAPAHAQSIIFADYETIMMCYDVFDEGIAGGMDISNYELSQPAAQDILWNFVNNQGAAYGTITEIENTYSLNLLTNEITCIESDELYTISAGNVGGGGGGGIIFPDPSPPNPWQN